MARSHGKELRFDTELGDEFICSRSFDACSWCFWVVLPSFLVALSDY